MVDSPEDQITGQVVFLPPRVSKTDAEGIFRQTAGGVVIRILQKIPFLRPPKPKPILTELLWLPHYIVSLRARRGTTSAVVKTLIETHTSAFSLLDDVSGFTEGETPQGQVLPAGCNSASAVEAAQRSFAIASLANKQIRHAKIEEILGSQQVYLPYWVCHYERRRDLRDFIVIDAFSGKCAPAKIKTAIIQAFVIL